MSEEFLLRNSSLSYKKVKTIWYVSKLLFHCESCTFLLEVITDTERLKIHRVVNALGSVVDLCTVPTLNNIRRVSELEKLSFTY